MGRRVLGIVEAATVLRPTIEWKRAFASIASQAFAQTSQKTARPLRGKLLNGALQVATILRAPQREIFFVFVRDLRRPIGIRCEIEELRDACQFSRRVRHEAFVAYPKNALEFFGVIPR